MRKDFDEEVLKSVPYELKSEASRYLANLRLWIQRRYRLYSKLKEKVVNLRKERDDLELQIRMFNKQIKQMEKISEHQRTLINRIESLDTNEEFLDKREYYIRQKEKKLVEKDQKLDQKLHMLVQKEEKVRAIQHAQQTSLFTPTPQEEKLFINEREAILNGIQQWGTVSRVLAKCPFITSKVWTIKYYQKKFPEFAMDMQMCYEIWKDQLDSEVIERALDGTEKPVFSKGEYIGEYKFKSDKLLELAAKAHVPEKYDRGKMDRIEGGGTQVTYNIVNFQNVNEEDEGCIRDIGVVKAVDKNGRIERITKDKNIKQNKDSKEPDENYVDVEEEQPVIDV